MFEAAGFPSVFVEVGDRDKHHFPYFCKDGLSLFLFFFFLKKKKTATYKNIYNTFRWIYVYRKYFIVDYFRYFYTFQNVLIGINVRAPMKPDLLNDLSV